MVRVEPQAGQQAEGGGDRRTGFQPGQVHAQAEVRAAGEGQVLPGVAAADVEAVRVRESGRVPPGAGYRDPDEVPLADGGAAEFDVAGSVAVHDGGRGFEAQRLLDGLRQQPGIGADQAQLVAVAEQMPRRVGDHPFGGLDPAEHEHRRVGDDLCRAEAGTPGVGPAAPAGGPQGRPGRVREQ